MEPLITIKELSEGNHQKIVRLRGRVFSKKKCGKLLFLVLRDGLHTLQGLASKIEADGVGGEGYLTLSKIENESYIEVVGMINQVEHPIKACSQQWLELSIGHFTILSRSVLSLPITLKEAAWHAEHKSTASDAAQLAKRLDHRVLDLRTQLSQSIFQIYDGLLGYMQSRLREQGFIEIKTPKLVSGSSEGGANVFKVDYLSRQAYLAQSPQLYKQMAIAADFNRVFEVGPVFRAEKSNSNRHLTEFVGIDLEMVIDQSYMEVVHLVYELLYALFEHLNQRYEDQIAYISTLMEVPKLNLSPKLVLLQFKEVVAWLQKNGSTRSPLEDLSSEEEKQLGKMVREKYGTDLYVITHYPSAVRPFYTMVDDQDPTYSHSYDFMLRGEEIISGAQRIHNYELLVQSLTQRNIETHSVAAYLDGFKYGAPPHAGVGIGLERLLKTFLGLLNVRYTSLFPRDPSRLWP